MVKKDTESNKIITEFDNKDIKYDYNSSENVKKIKLNKDKCEVKNCIKEQNEINDISEKDEGKESKEEDKELNKSEESKEEDKELKKSEESKEEDKELKKNEESKEEDKELNKSEESKEEDKELNKSEESKEEDKELKKNEESEEEDKELKKSEESKEKDKELKKSEESKEEEIKVKVENKEVKENYSEKITTIRNKMKDLVNSDIFKKQNVSLKKKKEPMVFKTNVLERKPIIYNNTIKSDYTIICSICSLEDDEWISFADGEIKLLNGGIFMFIRNEFKTMLLKFKYKMEMFKSENNYLYFEAAILNSSEVRKFRIKFDKVNYNKNLMEALKKYK